MAAFTTFETKDPQNYPCEIWLNNVQLPINTVILLNGEKVIAESKILDGVSVFERISRKPFEINLEFTILKQNKDIDKTLKDPNKYIFPQIEIENLMKNIYLPNSVLTVRNTYLNGIGINELVVMNTNLTPLRGSTSVTGSIKCKENYNDIQGGTLVIN